MSGPGIAWYLGVAAFLFGIGALGVLIRRNPLIVLLSLELMLHGANLALIAFARHAQNGAGQVFAVAVIAVAPPEVRVGIRLGRAIDRLHLSTAVHDTPGMDVGRGLSSERECGGGRAGPCVGWLGLRGCCARVRWRSRGPRP